MRILEPLKASLAIAALLLALTVAAQAQGPGGGGSGNGGGSRGPGGNGAAGRSGSGGPAGSAPDPGGPVGIGRPGGDRSSATAKPPSATAGPTALDTYVRGPQGALDAVEANQALPLDQIVAATRHLTDGEIIDAQLNAVNGALQYEVKVLEATGAVRRFVFDARTAQLAEVR